MYWAQLFLLPKKIKKMIEVVSRSYLWIGEATITKKAPLAWENVCVPRCRWFEPSKLVDIEPCNYLQAIVGIE